MPSETPEPTQEQRERAEKLFWAWRGDRAAPPICDLVAAAMAAEAAPLREEIERLTKERDEARDQLEVMGSMELTGKGALMLNGDAIKRADAANAKVLSLEAEIERLRVERDDAFNAYQNALKNLSEAAPALAAASRAREEQGALRTAALEDALRGAKAHIEGTLFDMNPADHPDELLAEIDRALAPPAAESQENQQQLTGKGQ